MYRAQGPLTETLILAETLQACSVCVPVEWYTFTEDIFIVDLTIEPPYLTGAFMWTNQPKYINGQCTMDTYMLYHSKMNNDNKCFSQISCLQ